MRRFFQKQSAKPKQNKMVDSIQEVDGKLFVVLSGDEYKDKMETYLDMLKSDMRLDNHTSKLFSFEYKSDSKTFIISPSSDVAIKDLLKEFAAVKLYALRSQTPGRRHK